MPLFIDVHDLTDATPEQVAEAHVRDVAVQDDHGVNYIKYWMNQDRGKVFCLCTAPNAEAAEAVHQAAHGLVAERILEVDPDLVDGMLGGGQLSPSGAATVDRAGKLDSGVRTILFTDIVGSTELTQRLGDRAAMEIIDLHDRVVREALGRRRGREVKHVGDGIMGVFIFAADAVGCAVEVHAALQAEARSTDEPVLIRVGIATGEPLERNGDFFGATVQLAARLCAQAAPGRTLVSAAVVESCDDRRFAELGELALKGFVEPVRAWAVDETR